MPAFLGVLVWLSASSDTAVSEDGVKAQLVSTAVDVLAAPTPADATEADLLLRSWAVEILVEMSPVRLDPRLGESLAAGQLGLFESCRQLAAGAEARILELIDAANARLSAAEAGEPDYFFSDGELSALWDASLAVEAIADESCFSD